MRTTTTSRPTRKSTEPWPDSFAWLSSKTESPEEVFNFKPNFNNKYSYDLPITRTPPEKESWQNSFEESSPFQFSDGNEQAESKEDFASYELPKWPYVENLWKDVDKIVGDLKTEEDLYDKLKEENELNSSINNIWSDAKYDSSEKYETDELFNEINGGVNHPPFAFVEKVTERPNQAYWQRLKEKHNVISAHTEMYNDATSTKSPPVSGLSRLPAPTLYHSDISILSGQVVTEPQLIEGDNTISFDSSDQPPAMPYANNPSILVARRNISSSTDILDYLSTLMSAANKMNKRNDFDQQALDRGTTIRTFFKSDLLQGGAISDPRRPELDIVEEVPAKKEIFNSDFNSDWLTAGDLLDAAANPDLESHSPIVLIPFENSQPLADLDFGQFEDSFTILDLENFDSPTNNQAGFSSVNIFKFENFKHLKPYTFNINGFFFLCTDNFPSDRALVDIRRTW